MAAKTSLNFDQAHVGLDKNFSKNTPFAKNNSKSFLLFDVRTKIK